MKYDKRTVSFRIFSIEKNVSKLRRNSLIIVQLEDILVTFKIFIMKKTKVNELLINFYPQVANEEKMVGKIFEEFL